MSDHIKLSGKKIADSIYKRSLEKNIALKNFDNWNDPYLPNAFIVTVSSSPQSDSYIKMIVSKFQNIGINPILVQMKKDVSPFVFCRNIEALQKDDRCYGIAILKFPKDFNIYDEDVQEKMHIHPMKDIDGITRRNKLKLLFGDKSAIAPCTAQAVIELLKGYKIHCKGKHVVVVGRSHVVGKPVSELLLQRNATVTICHSKTTKLAEITRKADILITAVGKAKMFNEQYIKKNAIVIDIGINTDENGKICGDCDFDSMFEKAHAITPVPGGIGPITTAVLGERVIDCYNYFNKIL